MGIKSVSALSKLSENNDDDVQTIEKIVDGDIPVYAYMLKAIKAAKTIKTDLLMIDYYQSARKTPGNSFVFKILFSSKYIISFYSLHVCLFYIY